LLFVIGLATAQPIDLPATTRARASSKPGLPSRSKSRVGRAPSAARRRRSRSQCPSADFAVDALCPTEGRADGEDVKRITSNERVMLEFGGP
jgi:hypothetical protein